MPQPTPKPFKLHIPDSAITDLKERLARTRWPETPPGEPWITGADPKYIKDICDYWRDTFDWRAWEAKLNALPQYTVPLAGIDLHYIHVPSPNPKALPLLVSHGWPGSVFEFHKLIPRLTQHFTIVAPSLPGYTLSYRPGQPRFSVDQMADVFHTLMRDVLGYPRYGAQGGDWGGFVTAVLGARYGASLAGVHVNFLALRRDLKLERPSDEEARYLRQLDHFLKEETGYQWIQGTKPATLGLALHDSPAGLAAWIVEKFRTWTDCAGNPEAAVSRDEMLADIALYWFTGAIASSFWPYYARMHGPWPIPDGVTVDVPAGYVEFPKEIIRPPRSMAAKMYTDIRRWTVKDKGGHFAALEHPDVLAEEITEFFRGIGAIA